MKTLETEKVKQIHKTILIISCLIVTGAGLSFLYPGSEGNDWRWLTISTYGSIACVCLMSIFFMNKFNDTRKITDIMEMARMRKRMMEYFFIIFLAPLLSAAAYVEFAPKGEITAMMGTMFLYGTGVITGLILLLRLDAGATEFYLKRNPKKVAEINAKLQLMNRDKDEPPR